MAEAHWVDWQHWQPIRMSRVLSRSFTPASNGGRHRDVYKQKKNWKYRRFNDTTNFSRHSSKGKSQFTTMFWQSSVCAFARLCSFLPSFSAVCPSVFVNVSLCIIPIFLVCWIISGSCVVYVFCMIDSSIWARIVPTGPTCASCVWAFGHFG